MLTELASAIRSRFLFSSASTASICALVSAAPAFAASTAACAASASGRREAAAARRSAAVDCARKGK